MRSHEAENREQDRPEEARLPLSRQARRRLELAAADEAIRERYTMPRKDRRAFARFLRKLA